ncbi:MAG TPA: hypothetical protein EYG51_10145 [Pseudomonadales bacterium]|nr:hypothetical protein [Pseudomonadales bacterium]
MKISERQLKRLIRKEAARIAEDRSLDPSRLSQASVDRQRAYDVFHTLQVLQAGDDIDPYGTTVTWDQLERTHEITRDDIDLLAQYRRLDLRREPYIRVTPQGIEFTAEGGYWEVG